MTYTLVALFLSTGAIYTERTDLTLLECAAYAAMTRQQALILQPMIGEVRYMCVPQSTNSAR